MFDFKRHFTPPCNIDYSNPQKGYFFEYQFSSKLSNRLQTTKIDSWVTSMEKKVSSNSLINIYLLLNYKTLLKGHLANQWSLYTQPFLIYCFFYSVAFWLYQYVCLHSINTTYCTQAHSINYVVFILFISLFLSFFSLTDWYTDFYTIYESPVAQ